MSDLVQKLFQQDLTEAEQDALEEDLLSSEDAAIELEALAKQAYVRYGLPEPQWRGPEPRFPHLGGGGSLGLWCLGIFVMGVLLFNGWRHAGEARSFFSLGQKGVGATESESTLSHKAANDLARNATGLGKNPGVKALVDSAEQNSVKELKKQTISSQSTAPLLMARVPSQTEVASKDGAAERMDSPEEKRNGAPGEALSGKDPSGPVPWNPAASKTYSNLAVQVDQAALGFMTVRVLGAGRREIKVLYQGNLEPGKWVFEWNGKLPNNRPADPGYYQIELKSGTFVGIKGIEIRK